MEQHVPVAVALQVLLPGGGDEDVNVGIVAHGRDGIEREQDKSGKKKVYRTKCPVYRDKRTIYPTH
jgi:hypothetical protein